MDPSLKSKWAIIRDLRQLATGALEEMRRDKQIGSSLEARVAIGIGEEDAAKAAQSVDFTEICIAAEATVEHVPGLSIEGNAAITTSPTNNHKCGRCWRLLPEVEEDGDLCNRCNEVVNG